MGNKTFSNPYFLMKPTLLLTLTCLICTLASAQPNSGSTTQAIQRDVVLPVDFSHVTIQDNFWSPRLEKLADSTLPVCIDQIENKTGRIRNFENAAKGTGTFSGYFFDDSDVYKALEGISYHLINHPDSALRKTAESWVAKIAAAQQPDGYINTYYTLKKGLNNRWTNMDAHEMYCAVRVSFSENPEYTVQVGPFRCKFPANFVFKLINRFEKLNNMGNKKMKVFTYGENPAEIVSAPCVYLDAKKEFKTGKKKIKKITDSLALLRMAGGRFRLMYHISGTWYQVYDCINGGADYAEKLAIKSADRLSQNPDYYKEMVFAYECCGGAYDQIIVAMRAAYVDSETSQNLNTKEEEVKPVVEHYFVKKKTDLEQLIESGDLDSINEMIKQKEEALSNAIENVNYYKEIGNIEFMENEEVRAGRLQRDLELLKTAIKETSNTKNMDYPAYGDSETSQTLEQEEQEEENRIRERFPLEGVTVEENTTGPNGVIYFTVEGAGPVTEARVRADLKPGDTFNVYTKDERKYGVTYDGVSLNRSIWNELPGIVEYEGKYYPEDCPTDADGNRFYTDIREDYAPFPYVVVDRLDGSVWFFTDSEDEAKDWAADYNREYSEGGKRKKQPDVEHEVIRTDLAKCAG